MFDEKRKNLEGNGASRPSPLNSELSVEVSNSLDPRTYLMAARQGYTRLQKLFNIVK